ncbi:putative cytokinetic ring protein SteA [Corynebacterium aquatimens]|uniref:Membrane-anchored protein n=1 Tax=Corynebacterium aquatimens TaxID=1190508 RepID=A0A931GT66_9CORY|nr:putative cytokinetic ring protein SteA [Corynebacterium aquatimens]MBG6121545.1 putative membrane-anchored protein [Corynebacterium aquatimens]WJY65914.1 hypothetical protein CAQUA_06040 [Corynebacterium aquatimens]
MSVFSPSSDTEGRTGVRGGNLRDCTPQGKGRGLRKLGAGDIAVVDSPDMSRREAQFLADARPAAVINFAQFSTGKMPNYGPLLLMDADIPLFENASTELRGAFRDGKKGAVHPSGDIYVGKKLVAEAAPVERDVADDAYDVAQRNLVENMEAFFGNTTEFIHAESPLLVDGVGVPDLGDMMDGRKVLVVSPAVDTREKIGNLRHFIREFQPVIIGVGAAADTLLDLGYSCDLIVGDPAEISADNLRGDAKVILPADPDGHAAGLERIQDLGVGARTFPAATDSATDLAILLAVFHNSEIIVTVGDELDLDSIFALEESATPAAALTRLKGGYRIVDAAVIESLYRPSNAGGFAWAWAILGILVALATVILVVGLTGNGSFNDNLIDTWNNFALHVQGWFNPSR